MLRFAGSQASPVCPSHKRYKDKSGVFGGVVQTGEGQSIRRRTCYSATLSTTNPKRTDPGSNPVFNDERPATNSLSHGTPPKTELIDMTFEDSVRTAQRTCFCFH